MLPRCTFSIITVSLFSLTLVINIQARRRNKNEVKKAKIEQLKILYDREFANLYSRATKSKDKKNKEVIK